MRRAFTMVVVATLFALAVSAAAPGGELYVFSDAYGGSCVLRDTPGVTQYYVVHTSCPGAIAISFSAPLPSCHTGTWVSDTPAFPSTTGDSQQGATVAYGSCLASPILVVTINLQTFGTTPPCCCYPPAANPAAQSGEIEVVDCSQETVYIPHDLGSFVSNGVLCVGVDGLCGCEAALPVAPTTWGGIKALYAQ